jgi:hypothetical protein
MDESLFDKFSRLTHRGEVPKLLFEEMAGCADSFAIFLVKKGILLGWHAANLPLFTDGKELREIHIDLDHEENLAASLQKGKIIVFKVPIEWQEYKFFAKNNQDLMCGSFPLKYGNKIFGLLLCFKKESFQKKELNRIKEVVLCASEFAVILPPPVRKEPVQDEKKEETPREIETILDTPNKAEMFSRKDSPEEKVTFSQARILARLLVNDIKLYHEQDVILGRLKKDLRVRLKKEIEKAEKFYNKRIPGAIREEGNLFEKELVENLAGGDPSALGSL